MSVSISICMCRLTITAMTFLGMLGPLVLGISPWQGSTLAGVEQNMPPTLGTSSAPSRFQYFTSWDQWGISCHLSLNLGWLPWQKSSLAGVGQNMSPTLATSSGLSRSYKRVIFLLCTGLVFTIIVTH